MKKILSLTIFIFSLWTCGCAKEVPVRRLHTISEINKIKSGNNYTTEGYVVFKYQCPPCPADAMCEPCMENNVIISEKNELKENYNGLTDKELILYTDKSGELELGKKYFFVVSIKPIASIGPRAVVSNQWWTECPAPPDLAPGKVAN